MQQWTEYLGGGMNSLCFEAVLVNYSVHTIFCTHLCIKVSNISSDTPSTSTVAWQIPSVCASPWFNILQWQWCNIWRDYLIACWWNVLAVTAWRKDKDIRNIHLTFHWTICLQTALTTLSQIKGYAVGEWLTITTALYVQQLWWKSWMFAHFVPILDHLCLAISFPPTWYIVLFLKTIKFFAWDRMGCHISKTFNIFWFQGAPGYWGSQPYKEGQYLQTAFAFPSYSQQCAFPSHILSIPIYMLKQQQGVVC